MSVAEPPALAFDDVSVVRGGRLIWSEGTFDVPSGGITAVIGSNGSGKTTLLQVVLGLVPVASGTVEVLGHDGWADGRLGNYARSPVLLNDFRLIEELTWLDQATRLRRLQQLGDEAAAALKGVLLPALEAFPTVIVATHVPPFKEACWHEGQISNDDWLPFFTCKAVGDVLLEAARRHPARRLEVLCGHTHGEGVAQLAPNLIVRTGAADYGSPTIAGILDLGAEGLSAG